MKNFTIEDLRETINELDGLFFEEAKLCYDSLDTEIYDEEFVANSENLITLKSKVDISSFLKFKYGNYCSNDLNLIITFDKCEVASAKFVFDIKKLVETDILIELYDDTCSLTYDSFFKILKEDLSHLDIKLGAILKVPDIYSVISTNEMIDHPSNDEIFGISWFYPEYKKAHNDFIIKIISNNLCVQKEDVFVITMVTSFLMLLGSVEYLEDHVLAIEMACRHKFLLKKIDFQINELFNKINQIKATSDMENELKKIRTSEIRLNSDLEFYRNTTIFVTEKFLLLFETFNNVFKLNQRYNSVQDKLHTCKSVYQSLYDEQLFKYEQKRKKQLDIIQWAVLILGTATLIVTIIGLFIK